MSASKSASKRPTYITMCARAMTANKKSRKGTSRAAVKNHMAATYAFDPQTWAIRNALNKGVADGHWTQDGARFHLTSSGKSLGK